MLKMARVYYPICVQLIFITKFFENFHGGSLYPLLLSTLFVSIDKKNSKMQKERKKNAIAISLNEKNRRKKRQMKRIEVRKETRHF